MTARGDATRARLLAAATGVVAQVGYSRATTKAIAEAAGVSEGTIYRHFPDKPTLFFAAALDGNLPVTEWMAGLPALAGEHTVRENLTECLRTLARLRADVVPLELAMLTDPELRERRDAALRELLPADLAGSMRAPSGPPGLLAAYLAAEQRLGRIRDSVDPVRAALTILATLFGVALLMPAADDHAIDPAGLEAAVDLFVNGLT